MLDVRECYTLSHTRRGVTGRGLPETAERPALTRWRFGRWWLYRSEPLIRLHVSSRRLPTLARMANNGRAHPDDVKLALVSAIVDDGLSYKGAVAALSRGELEDAPAYDFPLSSVGRYVSEFKRKRLLATLHPDVETPDNEFNDEQYRRAKSRVLRLGEQIDARLAKGDLGLDQQARLIREHTLAVKAVEAIAPKPQRKAQRAETTPSETRERDNDTLKRIVDRAGRGVARGAENGDEQIGASGRDPSLGTARPRHAHTHDVPADPAPAVAETVA